MLEDGGSRLLIGPSHLMTGAVDAFRVRDRAHLELLIVRFADRPEEIAALRRLVANTDATPRQCQPDRDMIRSLVGHSLGWPLVAALVSSPTALADATNETGEAVDLTMPSGGVSDWTLGQRLAYVVEHALPQIDDKIREEVRALLTPEALGAFALFIGAMAVATATGVGAAFAVFATAVTFAMLGWNTGRFLAAMVIFLDNLVGATSRSMLNKSAEAFASAITIGGLTLVRLLLRGGYRNVKAKRAAARAKTDKPSLDTPASAKPVAAAQAADGRVLLKPETPGIREPDVVPSSQEMIRQVATRSLRGRGPALDHADDLGKWPTLPASQAKNFASDPLPDRLSEGTKLYRVLGSTGNKKGAYWSLEPPPANEGAFRSGYAVKNDWSSASSYITVTVPKGGLPVWRGPTAAQVSSDKRGFLPGGKEQLWLDATKLDTADPMPTPWNK